MSKIDFLKQYSVVFDLDGNVKLCGRNACKDLILAAIEVSGEKTPDYFGSLKTGMMNIERINVLKESLANE